MDKLNALFLALFLLYFVATHVVDALIGLRPPTKKPPTTHKPVIPISPGPMEQLHTPYEYPDTRNISKSNLDRRGNSDGHLQPCHTVPLLRCAYRILRQSIQNETDVCRQVQSHGECVLDILRKDGRRDFVTGLTLLDNMKRSIYNSHICEGNLSLVLPTHTRHNRAKRYLSPCCVGELLNCTIQTFLKMIAKPLDTCSLLAFYDVCLYDTNSSCKLNTSYPIFTSQLNRNCKQMPKRRRRDNSS